MTLEEKLTAMLQSICPRAFCDFAPTETARPYVIWQQLGGSAPGFIDKTVPSKENAFVQVSVWSDSRAEAKDVIKQIEVALIQSGAVQASPLGAAASDSDSDMRRYCSRQDFDIWSDR